MKHIKLYENFITESAEPQTDGPFFQAVGKDKKPLLVFFKYDLKKPDTDKYNIGRIILTDVERTVTTGTGKGKYVGSLDHTNNAKILGGKPEKVILRDIDQDTKVGDAFGISMIKDGKEVEVEKGVFFLMATNDKNADYVPK